MGFMTRRNMIQRAAVKVAPVTKEVVKPVKKVKEPVKAEEPVKKAEDTISKKDIQSKPFFWLKKVAVENGIEVGDMKTAELRAVLIERLGL